MTGECAASNAHGEQKQIMDGPYRKNRVGLCSRWADSNLPDAYRDAARFPAILSGARKWPAEVCSNCLLPFPRCFN
jgi:hypothetical protein